jgi:hypothetical protein
MEDNMVTFISKYTTVQITTEQYINYIHHFYTTVQYMKHKIKEGQRSINAIPT